jgi:hypothetical protein
MTDDFRPAFVGPFTLLGTNVVSLNYSKRFQLLNPTVHIIYLRPYRLRTPDIGPPPKSLSAKPLDVSHQAQIEKLKSQAQIAFSTTKIST